MMMIASCRSRFTLRELLEGIQSIPASLDRRVDGITLDSRQVHAGDLFLALSGAHRHGRDFVEAACRTGASAVLVDAAEQGEQLSSSGVPVINVRDLKRIAGSIAARFYGEPSRELCVVGVTGTNGKSTVTHLIAMALRQNKEFGPCALIGTLGVGFPGRLTTTKTTTPDPVTLQRMLAEMHSAHARAAAMEVSSHALDQWRVGGVHFAVAVFTNLTRDHLDYHGDMDRYGKAKRLLFDTPGLGAAVVNIDDEFGRKLLASLRPGLPAYAYTLNGQSDRVNGVPLVSAKNIAVTRDRVSMEVCYQGASAHLTTRLLGRFNAANALAALTALLAVGVGWETAVADLQGVPGVSGRMEAFQDGDTTPLVVVDYAHTPDGLRQVLLSAREFCAGKLWCVFGCGGNRDPGKRPIMGAIAAEFSDEIIVTSDNPRDEEPDQIIDAIIKGMPASGRTTIEPDREKAIAMAVEKAEPHDVVVIAGKGHEDYQEVRGQRLRMSDRALVLAALRGRVS